MMNADTRAAEVEVDAAKFSTNHPPGTPVIVLTPDSYRMTCSSVITSSAWSDGRQAFAWVDGFLHPQIISRITPIGEVVA